MRQQFRAIMSHTDVDWRELLRGGISSLGIKIIAAAAIFGMNVVVARFLGIDQAGFFFLAFTFVTIFAAVGRVGLDNTLVRFIAAEQSSGQRAAIRGLYRLSIKWTLGASVFLAATLSALSPLISVHVLHKPAFAEILAVMAWSIPLNALFVIHAKALQGMQRIPQAMFLFNAAAPLVFLIIAILFRPADATHAGFAYLGASLITLLAGITWWHQETSFRGPITRPITKDILASCLPLLAVVILNRSIVLSGVLFLGVWGTAQDVAVFTASQRTAVLISLILIAVNAASAPKFAGMFKQGHTERLKRLAQKTTRLVSVIALAPLTAIIIYPEEILMIFGPDYAAHPLPLQILAIGEYVYVATGSVAILLTMTGFEQLLRNITLFSAAITLVMGALLTATFGLIGAAVATAFAVALQNLLCVWQVKRVHGFSTFGK